MHGIERKFKVINWAQYNAAKRFNPSVPIKDYYEVVTLKYERLPGYEHLSQKEYAKLMYQKLEERRLQIVAERREKNLKFIGRENLLRIRRGALPKNTKTSTIDTHRPRVLSVCNERRAQVKNWYFSIYFEYIEASKEYRSGSMSVQFPEGTYKPYIPPPPT